MTLAVNPFGDDLDDINAQIEANRPDGPAAPGGAGAARAPTPTEVAAALWLDDDGWQEKLLRPRPWVVPGFLLRGSVTLLAGPGSAGKSSLVAAWAVALALGEPFGRFAPNHDCVVLVYNVEDDRDEQRRRLSAALRHADAHPEQLRGRLVRLGPTGVGTLLERDAFTGKLHRTAAWLALEGALAARKPDVLVLDPLIELHTAEENDNTALRLVLAHFRELATRHGIAVVLVHHVRKGGTAGDVDSIRGAGSLVGAARSAFTLFPMSEDEARDLDINPALRRHYVRLDSAKQNYSPAREADWHELAEHALDNGEAVAAIRPWTPPAGLRGPTEADLDAIARDVEEGTQQGAYSPRLAIDQERSVAPLLAKHGVTRPDAQKEVLKRLLGRGFSVQSFVGPDRKTVKGLRAPSGAPKCRWVSGSAQEGMPGV